MKQIRFSMVLFGFVAAWVWIFGSYALSPAAGFSIPFDSGLGFVAQYYLLSLTFLVIFMVASSWHGKAPESGKWSRWLGIPLLSFSIGSIGGSALFLLILGFIFSNLSFSF